MTRKDYVMIASIITDATAIKHSGEYAQAWASGCDSARNYIAEHLADKLASDNPRFDRARFLKACGVNS